MLSFPQLASSGEGRGRAALGFSNEGGLTGGFPLSFSALSRAEKWERRGVPVLWCGL